MGSKLPDDLKWTESAAALLAETDKTSAKSVCITVKKAAEAKETKEAAMEAITCVCKWAKEAGVRRDLARARLAGGYACVCAYAARRFSGPSRTSWPCCPP